MKIRRVSVKEAYRLWARRYEQDLPYLFEMESEKLIPLLGNVKGKRILDFGCGTGRYSIALAKKGAIVSAVDLSEEMLNEARDNARKAKVKIDFRQHNLKKGLPYPKGSFDIVMSILVLNHFKNLEAIFKRIYGILNPNGFCVISTIHPSTGGKPILVQSLGLHARTYRQSVKEYFNAIKKANFQMVRCLELKFPKKIILKAKKRGIDLEPYSHKPSLMILKIKKELK